MEEPSSGRLENCEVIGSSYRLSSVVLAGVSAAGKPRIQGRLLDYVRGMHRFYIIPCILGVIA